MSRGAYLMSLGLVPYGEAFELQRALAGAVSQGAIPETVVFLEHPPVVTIGRRTQNELELHIPEDAKVEVAETDRGGKSTFHGPGQLVCYPILDLGHHGKDVKRYVRDLEEALIRTLAAFELECVRYEGLTGVWMPPGGGQGPRKIASIGVHVSRWITTHGYAQRPRPGSVHRVDHGLRARARQSRSVWRVGPAPSQWAMSGRRQSTQSPMPGSH
jgi:lipoyl(octanoyl) transferase